MRTSLFIIIVILLAAPLQSQEYGRTDTTYDVLKYDLHLMPDMNAQALEGTCRVLLRSNIESLTAFALDAVGMDSIALTRAGGITSTYNGVKLSLTLEEPLSKDDTLSVRLWYRTVPEKGMFFIAPDASFPNAPAQFYTHNQPDDARYWFPSHDVPWDKALFDIAVTADTGLEVASNGALTARESAGAGKTLWHYSMKQPVSTYLIAVAGGRFAISVLDEGPPLLQGWAYMDTPEEIVRLTYGETPEMLAFFEDYTGTPYPWNKYIQVPLHRFPYGGMENVTATFLSDEQVLLDQRAREDYDDQPLIAHELAHQWWGDLVTCHDWEDLWINEGFATYFQQLWTRKALGVEAFDYQRLEGVENVLRYLDGEEPLTVRAHTKNAPQNLYSKGAAILSMITDIIGEDAFRETMEDVFKDKAYGTITTAELAGAFQTHTALDMEAFLEGWLDRFDYPVIDISHEWDAADEKLRIHVAQKSSSAVTRDPFTIPIRLTLGDGITLDGILQSADTVWVMNMEEAPAFLAVANIIPARIQTGNDIPGMLAQLRTADGIAVRIAAVDGLIQSLGMPEVRQGLLKTAVDDPFHGVRFRIIHALSELSFDTISWRQEAKQVFTACLDDERSRIRATAINALSKFNESALEPQFRTRLQDPSYHVEAAAMNALAAMQPPDLAAIVRGRMVKTSYKDILANAALNTAGEYALREVLPEVRSLAAPGQSMQVRFNAMKTLIRIETDETLLLKMLQDMLAEPNSTVRYIALSAIAGRFPGQAEGIFKDHLQDEKSEELRTLIKGFLGQ